MARGDSDESGPPCLGRLRQSLSRHMGMDDQSDWTWQQFQTLCFRLRRKDAFRLLRKVASCSSRGVVVIVVVSDTHNKMHILLDYDTKR